jgi:addiction module HigA family antidote
MAAKQAQCAHPGSFVRASVIPAGMTVKDAASRLGIGRPALSNFLNGKAALSTEMAVRLEKAFGADRKQLLDMQAAFDSNEQESGGQTLAVRALVPSFLTIKAHQIERWADQDDARSRLPVLLRKLVHTSASDLRQVDFPGYDNSQRVGPDGFVEAGSATPWVPAGKSYWEFGTNKRPQEKAEGDYAARMKSVDSAERANSTFVFVTPRNWTGKTAWEQRKKQAGEWKDVRVFDASDLEQWLEQSLPAQIWLAEQLDLPGDGYESLEQAWQRWSSVSEPSLTPEIFAPSIEAYRERFKEWLGKPSERHFVVAADSKDEAIAYIACLFDHDDLRQLRDRAAVFTSPDTLKRLLTSSVPFIPIVHSGDTERELAGFHRRFHCIVVHPRNAADSVPDIAIDLLSYEAFRAALTAMGIDQGEFDRISRETGRSPTILRRHFSKNDEIKKPQWARDHETTKTLVPMTLIGAWHTDMKADCKIISELSKRDYETIEDDFGRLLGCDDTPVWSAGRYRGVVSKRDALFAIRNTVTQHHIERFFNAAMEVLSEADPALELPEGKRWAAAMYGKKREYSEALREGICETLVILSVHGNHLFQDRLDINLEHRVGGLIHRLLAPLTLERLLSQDHDLPRYAEAAPEPFLESLEQDLRHPDPVVIGLLKPVPLGAMWTSSPRTGLLWALECLAWNPKHLPRVTLLLAQLSRSKIDDNLVNKPCNALESVFRFWMPQTAASIEERIKAFSLLKDRFPDVFWSIALEQIRPGPRTGFYNYRPHWRSDASGAGQVVASEEERHKLWRTALDMLIAWPEHDKQTLGDLVECLQGMPKAEQLRVWTLINQWSVTGDELDKAELRERIRRYAFTRSGRKRDLGEESRDHARQAYDNLKPRDPVIRHAWLFANQWVQESPDEFEDGDFDYRKRHERIERLRREAMAEIWSGLGLDGVHRCLSGSGDAITVGRYAATCVTIQKQRIDFILACLTLAVDLMDKGQWCIQGFLSSVEEEKGVPLLRAVAKGLSSIEQIRLFVCAPFQQSTWRLLDEYGQDIRQGYWKQVIPSWSPHTPTELNEIIDRLLEAKRPRAAFHGVHMDFKDIETSRLKRLLHDVATTNSEPPGVFRLETYHISEALDSLQKRAGVIPDEMAQLEFNFIGALEHTTHGIPNLENQIAKSPVVFAQAVVLAYKRSDGGEDSPEWRIENHEQKVAMAEAARRLLDLISKIPGTDSNRQIDHAALGTWLAEVRRFCKGHARADIGDHWLGQLLSRAPAGENGTWPCEAVCQAMEEVASPEIGNGFLIGTCNSRGVYMRGEGGDEERELAAKYRGWAERLQFDFPYVGGILERIASSYDDDAEREDAYTMATKRLRQ